MLYAKLLPRCARWAIRRASLGGSWIAAGRQTEIQNRRRKAAGDLSAEAEEVELSARPGTRGEGRGLPCRVLRSLRTFQQLLVPKGHSCANSLAGRNWGSSSRHPHRARHSPSAREAAAQQTMAPATCRSIRCKNCGATITLPADQLSAVCPFLLFDVCEIDVRRGNRRAVPEL